MPELPEAETIARQLNERLAGERLGRVVSVRPDIVHGRPAMLRRDVPGLYVERVYRRAKRVVLELSKGDRRLAIGGEGSAKGNEPAGMGVLQIVFHLGMSGRLMVCSADEPVEKHTHLRIAVEDCKAELRFRDPRRFGGVWILRDGDDREVESRGKRKGKRLGPVGPEPLEIRPAAFRDLLQRKRAIKALLLDQTVIAGLGNIYCDESLFASRVHPMRPAATLSKDEATALLRSIKSVLRRAIEFNGSTLVDYRSADGEPGSFQRLHRVYNRGGKPCKSCNVPIERLVVAGRTTWYCPNCQRLTVK